MIFRFCRNNLSDHVYLFLVVLLIFKVVRNNLSGHVYLFFVVLLIKVGRNNLSGRVYIFHVVMTCSTSTCQHKTTRPCKHYRNIRVWKRIWTYSCLVDIVKSTRIKSACCIINTEFRLFYVTMMH